MVRPVGGGLSCGKGSTSQIKLIWLSKVFLDNMLTTYPYRLQKENEGFS
jgi:hypothetical protein